MLYVSQSVVLCSIVEIEWQNDIVTEWPSGRVTKWSSDRVTKWPSDQVTEWQEASQTIDRMVYFDLVPAERIVWFLPGELLSASLMHKNREMISGFVSSQ